MDTRGQLVSFATIFPIFLFNACMHVRILFLSPCPGLRDWKETQEKKGVTGTGGFIVNLTKQVL